MRIISKIIPITVTFCLSLWVLIEGETKAYSKGTGEGFYPFLILLVGWVLIWIFIHWVGALLGFMSGEEFRLLSPTSAIWIASVIVSLAALLMFSVVRGIQ